MRFSRRFYPFAENQFQAPASVVERRDRLEVEADPLLGRACAACLSQLAEAFDTDKGTTPRLIRRSIDPPFTVDQFQYPL